MCTEDKIMHDLLKSIYANEDSQNALKNGEIIACVLNNAIVFIKREDGMNKVQVIKKNYIRIDRDLEE